MTASDVVETPAYKGISARAFEHPADRAATAALQAIPMLDPIVRKLIEYQYERAFRQQLLASSVRLGDDQLPAVHAEHRRAFRMLDVEPLPALYLTQFPVANAAAVGAEQPFVIVNSRLVELLGPDEQRAVLGHEAGHVLADHVLYSTALLILQQLTTNGIGRRLPFLAGLPLLGLQYALLEWSRAAELSSDRAAALVTRDPMVVCRTLMIMAGGAASRELNLDAFVTQAAEYDDWESGWDRLSRVRSELSLTHAYPVRRVRELMKWVQSGEYDRIVSGEYLRRDQPHPGARAEAGEAFDFYTERFRSAFRDAGDSVAKAGEGVAKAGDTVAAATTRLAEWVRGATAAEPKDDDL